ncbi:MAG: O-antigen ligase family protein [Blastocatellia bacterium]
MQNLESKLDELAGIESENRTVVWLERVAFVFLILMVVSAPHSIAATQTAWITGMFVWLIRLFFRPRITFRFGFLDLALWAFFAWSVVSSIFSYDPPTSLDKLRGTAVFLIFYFVYYNVRTQRAAHFLGFALIASCMVNVLWMPIERLIGRGVEIHDVQDASPLKKALLTDGDALLEANGKKLRTPEELVSVIEQNEITKVKFYRPDYEFAVDVKRADLLSGANAMERLGVMSWKKSHNWRSKGFYGHYATYAEVLQMIGSLALGLFVAGIVKRKRSVAEETSAVARSAAKLFSPIPILLFCVIAIGFALLLTVTRAPQLAFLISAGIIVFAGMGRKWFLAAALIVVPLVIGGLYFLQQSRQVGFFDSKDESTRYRLIMVRDGLRLWTENPQHFIVGVGMDSIKKNWREWYLFEGGKQPLGHFHSTPIQLLVERGLPALILWLAVLAAYLSFLWRGVNRVKAFTDGSNDIDNIATDLSPQSAVRSPQWVSLGILLGCLGGTLGFAASSLVHYNLGDQEVAMVFFMLMGIGVKITQISDGKPEAD